MPRSKQKPVIIVGAGLFGSIAAHLLARRNIPYTVIDGNYAQSGSKAAACLMAPSWMSGLGRDKVDIGIRVLNELFKVKTLTFKMNKLKDFDVLWVNPRSILNHSVVRDEVLCVGDGFVQTKTRLYRGKVLVAAGVWSEELVQMPPIKRLTGCALLYKGQTDPTVDLWAPYKQAVKFNITPSKIWFGDGTSVLRKNFTEDRVDATIKRACKHGLSNEPHQIIVGQRPYVQGEKGYFRKAYNDTWVSTGGAKNGTILAAYQAALFLGEIA